MAEKEEPEGRARQLAKAAGNLLQRARQLHDEVEQLRSKAEELHAEVDDTHKRARAARIAAQGSRVGRMKRNLKSKRKP